MNLEAIHLAFSSIRQNKARAIITCSIIGFGIMSLVGVLTAIDGLKSYINKDFSSMGANTFKIRNMSMTIQIGRSRNSPKVFEPISYMEAVKFKKLYGDKNPVNIQTVATATAKLKYQHNETNPNVSIFGVDEDYPEVESYNFYRGRNFSTHEMNSGADVCIIGYDVAIKLFENVDNTIGKYIIIDGKRYLVIGVLEAKGSSMITSDNFALIPMGNCRQFYTTKSSTYIIGVKVVDQSKMSWAIDEAIGDMRIVRKLRAKDENNFDIMKSDSISEVLVENLSYATIGGFVIGIITLLGAATGLVNIMLVSVTERTREIGTLKAIGARNNDILSQFLYEAILICVIGGFLGVLLGVAAGNAVSLMMGGAFIIPWSWMTFGIALCLIVGLLAGIYPAIKASHQDPIEALRFE
ncbi:MAG: ABC transporter permease [Chitinophagales bacterium]|nr:ABC transporter permease [Chitinophagales bacterium]